MRRVRFWALFCLGVFLWLGLFGIKQAFPLQTPTVNPQPLLQLAQANDNSGFKPFDTVTKDTEKLEGLFTLYRHKKTDKVYLEIKPEQLEKNYLGTVTLESGIGERGIYSGLPLSDLLFYFRRVNDNLHFVVRNVNFRAEPGDPQVRSLNRSFSDSVLYSLPIASFHPQRKSLLIDLGELMLTDLPGLTPALSRLLDSDYRLDSNKSYFGTTKAFPSNIEVESVYGFSSRDGKGANLPTLPDNRALTLRVRYSLSQLPENSGYLPRLADERVGYFFTAYQDLSNQKNRDGFVRYIHRWRLEKQDPSAALSPPKKPIVFWIENAVPTEYREAIREGILMWNQAFEAAGFKDAIQVQQMPDNPDWDPADVRYNTIRWFNSIDGFFARGPSRVNPLTGEILDADIMVDAGLVRSLQQDYRLLVEQNQSSQNSLVSDLLDSGNLCAIAIEPQSSSSQQPFLSQLADNHDLCYGRELSQQLAMGQMELSLLQDALPNGEEMRKFLHQYLRSLIAHEVGHTLGLRHNFRGSLLLEPEELNNVALTQTKGLSSSVMDYLPVNMAPKGTPQGEYFPSVVGVYDQWAIEYGYKSSDAVVPQAERRFLEAIAKRSVEPALTYATDEDANDLDPSVNRWDMSDDVLGYSRRQLDNARTMWARLEKRYPLQGESYTELSKRFDALFWHYVKNTRLIAKYVGGQSFSRNYAGTSKRLPFEAVPVAKQRQALAVLQEYLFAEDAFQFSPQLLNKLAPSRWRDWGNEIPVTRLDYPVHDSIFFLQRSVLRTLLSSDRLRRLRDIELKSEPNQALTLPELFETLEESIWTEVVQPKDKSLNISSIRRSLQRDYLEQLSNMVLRKSNVPEDARTLAWYRLRELQGSIATALRRHGGDMDTYTRAHLEETRDRISKSLSAPIQSQ
ncbi:MAG: zinc-dependent metalloprotease [Kastovskya adunca ATA6-11-RM4]|jgi:hypothetical protein|nr:zinc-dependent metalloprotease [Kastovskya adunca ATA6-11-RM4]